MLMIFFLGRLVKLAYAANLKQLATRGYSLINLKTEEANLKKTLRL